MNPIKKNINNLKRETESLVNEIQGLLKTKPHTKKILLKHFDLQDNLNRKKDTAWHAQAVSS
jgi:uncharacterized protein YoxC